MAFNKEQFRELIEDVLREANLYSPSAVELLMLTCAVESNFGTYIKQIKGPALGVFQMEPFTHNDIWANYLTHKDELVEIALWPHTSEQGNELVSLKTNLAYQILMARIHYLRYPYPLPDADDIEGLAEYWKRLYNTRHGKGTVKKAIEKYKEYCI